MNKGIKQQADAKAAPRAASHEELIDRIDRAGIRQGQVPEAMGQLDSALRELEDVADALIRKLEPIVSPSSPLPGDLVGKEGPSTPLASSLLALKSRVRTLTHLLEDVEQRVEL